MSAAQANEQEACCCRPYDPETNTVHRCIARAMDFGHCGTGPCPCRPPHRTQGEPMSTEYVPAETLPRVPVYLCAEAFRCDGRVRWVGDNGDGLPWKCDLHSHHAWTPLHSLLSG